MALWKTSQTITAARWLMLFSPLGVDLYLPAIPSMTLAFGDYVHFSLTLYMLSIGFGQLLWGSISDRLGRRPVALWGTALFSIASLCIPLSKTFADLCVLRCIQGLGASAASLCAATIIRDHLSGPQATREYGILGSIRNVVPVLAPLIGSGLLLLGDWTICFFFLSGIGVGLWIYLWFFMKETRRPSLELSMTKKLTPWKSIPFLGFSSCCCGALSLIFSYVTLAPNALITQGGLSMQQFGLVFGLNGLCIGLSCLWFIRYVEKKGALWVIRISLFFIGIGGLGLITQSMRTDFLSFIIPIFFMSTGFGALLGPANGLAMQPFSQSIGQAAALLGASQMLSAATVSSFMPYVPYSPRLTLGLLAITVAVLSGFICWYLTSRFGANALQGEDAQV